MSINRWMDTEIMVYIVNGILLSSKKEHIWVGPNEVDEPRAYCTGWSKSERERQMLYINTCVWNLERWYWWTYLQGSNWRCTHREQTCEQCEKERVGWIWESIMETYAFSSVQFSHSVTSDSLRPHESQHARPPCPSPTPRVHSNSRPSNQWCHPAISSSVVPFSSCPQCLPAAESFPVSQLFSWGGQSTGVSASTSFPPKKSQGWSPSE